MSAMDEAREYCSINGFSDRCPENIYIYWTCQNVTNVDMCFFSSAEYLHNLTVRLSIHASVVCEISIYITDTGGRKTKGTQNDSGSCYILVCALLLMSMCELRIKWRIDYACYTLWSARALILSASHPRYIVGFGWRETSVFEMGAR